MNSSFKSFPTGTTAVTIDSINNTVIKVEPRDEPIELTSQSRNEPPQPYSGMSQPLNIPQVIPMSQTLPHNLRHSNDNHYEEESRRLEKLERPERLDRPDRVERPERSEMGSITSTPIGQPPLPNLMQSSNLVTIGGSQPPAMNHYGFLPPFGHPQSPRNMEKPPQPHSISQSATSSSQNQNEPQNLKIKQVFDSNNLFCFLIQFNNYSCHTICLSISGNS